MHSLPVWLCIALLHVWHVSAIGNDQGDNKLCVTNPDQEIHFEAEHYDYKTNPTGTDVLTSVWRSLPLGNAVHDTASWNGVGADVRGMWSNPGTLTAGAGCDAAAQTCGCANLAEASALCTCSQANAYNNQICQGLVYTLSGIDLHTRRYRVVVRGFARGDYANAMWITADDGAANSFCNANGIDYEPSCTDTWCWDSRDNVGMTVDSCEVQFADRGTGHQEHQLRIHWKEDGLIIDRIFLTPDLDMDNRPAPGNITQPTLVPIAANASCTATAPSGVPPGGGEGGTSAGGTAILAMVALLAGFTMSMGGATVVRKKREGGMGADLSTRLNREQKGEASEGMPTSGDVEMGSTNTTANQTTKEKQGKKPKPPAGNLRATPASSTNGAAARTNARTSNAKASISRSKRTGGQLGKEMYKLLKAKAPRKLFQTFLEKEHSTENLTYYRTIVKFRKEVKSAQSKIAASDAATFQAIYEAGQRIFDEFVAPNSTQTVNVPITELNRAKRLLQELSQVKDVAAYQKVIQQATIADDDGSGYKISTPATVFDYSQRVIFNLLLSDSYPRFKDAHPDLEIEI